MSRYYLDPQEVELFRNRLQRAGFDLQSDMEQNLHYILKPNGEVLYRTRGLHAVRAVVLALEVLKECGGAR